MLKHNDDTGCRSWVMAVGTWFSTYGKHHDCFQLGKTIFSFYNLDQFSLGYTGFVRSLASTRCQTVVTATSAAPIFTTAIAKAGPSTCVPIIVGSAQPARRVRLARRRGHSRCGGGSRDGRCVTIAEGGLAAQTDGAVVRRGTAVPVRAAAVAKAGAGACVVAEVFSAGPAGGDVACCGS